MNERMLMAIYSYQRELTESRIARKKERRKEM
jgi:hypothetical protein